MYAADSVAPQESMNAIQDQVWETGDKVTISVICWTYNHDRYIASCLDSIIVQETDFRVEVVIHDDASTDNTRAILRRYRELYPCLIKLLLPEENQYRQGKDFVGRLLSETTGRYLAICDGDDYWCDPRKLDKQLKDLQKHTRAYLCAHNSFILDGDCFIKHEWRWNIFKKQYTCFDYLQESYFHTTSILMLRPERFPAWLSEVLQGDYTIVLASASPCRPEIRFLPEYMSVYRKHSNGVSSSPKNRDPRNSYKSHLRIVQGLQEIWPTEWQKLLHHKESELRILLRIACASSRAEKTRIGLRNIWILRFAMMRKVLRWVSVQFASYLS
jgi:glycosyltransferase involved in cell wall biosynthesis